MRRPTTLTVLAAPKDPTFSATKTLRSRLSVGASTSTKVPSFSSTTTPTTLQPHYQAASTPSMHPTGQIEPFLIEYYEESVNAHPKTNACESGRPCRHPVGMTVPLPWTVSSAEPSCKVNLVVYLHRHSREEVPLELPSQSLVLRMLGTHATAASACCRNRQVKGRCRSARRFFFPR